MKPPRNLRVLLVEDTPERQEILVSLYRDHAWILAPTALRAIRLLDAYEFDLVSLDYDLAGPERGDVVAKFVAESGRGLPVVVIHSMNQPGAVKIQEILEGAPYVPISRLTRRNRVFVALRDRLSDPDADLAELFRRECVDR